MRSDSDIEDSVILKIQTNLDSPTSSEVTSSDNNLSEKNKGLNKQQWKDKWDYWTDFLCWRSRKIATRHLFVGPTRLTYGQIDASECLKIAIFSLNLLFFICCPVFPTA